MQFLKVQKYLKNEVIVVLFLSIYIKDHDNFNFFYKKFRSIIEIFESSNICFKQNTQHFHPKLKVMYTKGLLP